MPTQTTVVNINTGKKCDVYVGRPSIFGNPYVIGRDGTRDEVIAAYKKYFLFRVRNDAEFREAVETLRGKVLGCYCSPQKCHADVIVEWFA
jgi:hypothetical protein